MRRKLDRRDNQVELRRYACVGVEFGCQCNVGRLRCREIEQALSLSKLVAILTIVRVIAIAIMCEHGEGKVLGEAAVPSV